LNQLFGNLNGACILKGGSLTETATLHLVLCARDSLELTVQGFSPARLQPCMKDQPIAIAGVFQKPRSFACQSIPGDRQSLPARNAM
jgi:hypothetical protein